MEICAGTETVSAYSHKPHLPPNLSHLTPFCQPSDTSNIFEMAGNVKRRHTHAHTQKKFKVAEVPFKSLSHSTPEQTLLQAGEALVMSGPIAGIRFNTPQHLAVTSPPTIKSSLVSDTGADLCGLAHSQPCAFIMPQPLCDRQD